jgi:ankyrin repeat protein
MLLIEHVIAQKNMKLESPGPRLSAEDIKEFEREIGYKLPVSYQRFLLKHNGGRPFPADFKQVIGGFKITNNVTTVLRLLNESSSGVRGTWRDAQQELPSGFLPFARDVGGEAICICLKGADYGAVYVSHGFVEYLGRPAEMRPLAGSFASFLGMLFDKDALKPHDRIQAIAEKGRKRDVLSYFENGGSLNDKTELGATLPIAAAANGNIEVLSTCMDLGANLSGTLITAVYNQKWDVMRFLVDRGADVNEVSQETGKSPLQAIYGVFGPQREEIVEYLKAHGAREGDSRKRK